MAWINVNFAGKCQCGRTVAAGERGDWQRGEKLLKGCNACNGAAPAPTTASTTAEVTPAPVLVSAATAHANLDKLLARLDADQAVVARWTPAAGNLRVIAAAGSGKTTTTVALVGQLIRSGLVPASQIIATTFTSKAGKELSERIAKVVEPTAFSRLRAGTFHGLAIRALRASGYDFDFSRCLDGSKRAAGIPASGLLWTCVAGWGLVKGTNLAGLDIADADTKAYALAADVIRSHGFEAGTLEARKAAREVESQGLTRFTAAWEAFAEAKRQLGAWDFADALAAYRAHLASGTICDGAEVVIVDEAQDNSFVQLDLARLLARQGRLILVGDQRQCIYSWRGAFPELFANADREIGAATSQIRQNYRSGRAIVAAANRISEGQSWSLGDDQNPARDAEGTVRVISHSDTAEEGEGIAAEIEVALTEGARADDFAILGRTNASLAPIEAALVQRRIPCVVVGGTSFFARREVKDALAYLTLAQGDDIEAFERIVNRPKRFLGKAFVAAVRGNLGGSANLLGAIKLAGYTVNSRQKGGVAELLSTIEELRAAQWAPDATREAGVDHPADLVAALLAPPSTNVDAGDDDKPGLVATVAAIARTFGSAAELTRFAAACEGAVAVASENDALPAGRVTVSTVYKGKGLEWNRVYVLATAGIFPHRRSAGKPDREAEEIRAFYVAITRAKDELILSWAENGPYKNTGGASPLIAVALPGGDEPRGPQGGGKPTPVASVVAAPVRHLPPAIVREAARVPSTPEAGKPSSEPHTVTAPAVAPAAPVPGSAALRSELAALDLLLPLATKIAEHATAATPKNADGSRFVAVTRADFEALLAPLGFVEGTAHRQVVYTRQLGPVDVRIYSTLPVDGEIVRAVGEDSLKVALIRAATVGAPERALMKKQPYCTRTRGWRVALLARIEEALKRVRGAPVCRKCGAPTVVQDGKEGRQFFGCIAWESSGRGCNGGAGDVPVSAPVSRSEAAAEREIQAIEGGQE